MKAKGFTLIELLAVIVILAIIALIATPIVLNIISESKESASLRSAQFYIDGVAYAITKKIMDEPTFNPSNCDISSDGNLNCESIEVKVEVSGEVPTDGTITLENGKITDVELVLNEKRIIKNTEGSLVSLKYKLGDEITFDPGDGKRNWNVIDEDNNTVTLILSENLGDTIEWNSDGLNNNGPITALEYLNSLTKDWDNVDPIVSYNYVNNLKGTAKPNGYQKLEINNGITTITTKEGAINKLDGETKARILTAEEIYQIASKSKSNFKIRNLEGYITKNLDEINTKLGTSATNVDELISIFLEIPDSSWGKYESKHFQLCLLVGSLVLNNGIDTDFDVILPDYLYNGLGEDEPPYGYWLLWSFASSSDRAWYINNDSVIYNAPVNTNSSYGIRPIITIPKSRL